MKSYNFVKDLLLNYQQVEIVTQDDIINTAFSNIPEYYVNDKNDKHPIFMQELICSGSLIKKIKRFKDVGTGF